MIPLLERKLKTEECNYRITTYRIPLKLLLYLVETRDGETYDTSENMHYQDCLLACVPLE